MKPEDILNILGADLEAVKDMVRSRLSSSVQLLHEVNSSILEHEGKLMRPALCLLMARACGHPSDDTIRYAAAVELMHNSSLLHDDVADASMIRRGVPTVMSLYGPVPAVLVGDFWLARTVDTVLGSVHRDWAIPAFSKTLSDLAEGEMLQQQKSFSCDTTEDDYRQIIYCKTASLFELSCAAAAMSVDASPELFSAAQSYGRAVGMAFQIRDDIMDYEGGDIGKPSGHDLVERKITLPLLGALRNSEDPAAVRELVRTIPEHPKNVASVVTLVRENGGLEYAWKVLHDYIDEALAALNALPPSDTKKLLAEFGHFNETRKK